MRIALGVEYHGTSFHGWQSQHNQTTVQAALETALSHVANEKIQVTCAGRTDAGVHATHQVIHFDTRANRHLDAWIFGTNSNLPSAINALWVKEVAEDFHARFSAIHRRYQYFIYNNKIRSSLFSSLTTWVYHPLDEGRISAAIPYLLGEHDFTSFRSADCQSRTAKRHIFALKVIRQGDIILIDIIANSFLHHMVRNIVGVLIEIGAGRKEPAWCQELLEAKDRKLAAKTALAHGLYLTGVRYADNYELPSDFRSPNFLSQSI